jgi:hypothetical protein
MNTIGEEIMPLEARLVEGRAGNAGLTWEALRAPSSSTRSNADSDGVVAMAFGPAGRSSAARADPPISAGVK